MSQKCGLVVVLGQGKRGGGWQKGMRDLLEKNTLFAFIIVMVSQVYSHNEVYKIPHYTCSLLFMDIPQ